MVTCKRCVEIFRIKPSRIYCFWCWHKGTCGGLLLDWILLGVTAFVSAALVTSCLLQTPGTLVHLLPHDFTRYWSQLEYQWPQWFVGQCLPVPTLPDRAEIRDRLRFFEVPWNIMQREGKHCTYNDWKIRVGTGQWSCVSHELGHAVCQFLDRPEGCEDYEHTEKRECTMDIYFHPPDCKTGIFSREYAAWMKDKTCEEIEAMNGEPL